MQSDPRVPEEGSDEGLQDPTDNPDRVGEAMPDLKLRAALFSQEARPSQALMACFRARGAPLSSLLRLWPP